MVFQFGIDLKIMNRDVQAVIDMDTGLLGFTERLESGYIEYNFLESPVEYRQALMEILSDKIAERTHANGQICRKAAVAPVIADFWRESIKAQSKQEKRAKKKREFRK